MLVGLIRLSHKKYLVRFNEMTSGTWFDMGYKHSSPPFNLDLQPFWSTLNYITSLSHLNCHAFIFTFWFMKLLCIFA